MAVVIFLDARRSWQGGRSEKRRKEWVILGAVNEDGMTLGYGETTL